MRVIQMVTTVAYGDAVGNDVIALDRVLRKSGYKTGIYAENADDRLPRGLVKNVQRMPRLSQKDVLIYHLAIGTELNFRLPHYGGRKIIIYHNITPHDYFRPYSISSSEACRKGEEALRYLSDKADYCLADSEYNKADMRKAGYQCAIDVLPILIHFEDYRKKPDEIVLKKYLNNGYTNILFVGRIAPNKKQEDVIRAFYMYQKYYNPQSRLFLVGSFHGMEKYYNKLTRYARELGAENVIFPGHIKFDEILAYYHIADVFLCMSAHEGFCVPLVEAMYFNVPIIAYNSSAIGDTLGDSGILLDEKNPLETAGLIHYLLTHPQLKEKVLEEQHSRLREFDNDKVEERFLELLEKFIERSR